MNRMTVAEIKYLIQHQDEQAKFLFVEGVTDSRMWAIFVPFSEREQDVSITPVTEVEIEVELDGERGRLLKLAELFNEEEFYGKVLFFIDADNDYLLPRSYPANVVITDGRDLEAYSYCDSGLITFCFLLGKDPITWVEVMGKFLDSLRNLGLLRAASRSVGANLPFKKHFVQKPKGCISHSSMRARLNFNRVKSRLMAEARPRSLTASKLDAELDSLGKRFESLGVFHVVCGKDFLAFVSEVLAIDLPQVSMAMRGALVSCREELRQHPNFSLVEAFVRS